MSLSDGDNCPNCGAHLKYTVTEQDRQRDPRKTPGVYSRVIGVEYGYGHPHRYDGVSEWRCPDCGYREGRWTGRPLREGESEPRFGGAP